MYLELATVPSLYLGRACSEKTPSLRIRSIFSLKIVSAFVIFSPLFLNFAKMLFYGIDITVTIATNISENVIGSKMWVVASKTIAKARSVIIIVDKFA